MIWKCTKAELITFIKELNEKQNYQSDFQISPRKITFLDLMLHKDENNIQRTLYCKPTDEQVFVHAKSKHLRSLKNSIPHSHVLRLKTIYLTTTEYDKNCASIIYKFLDKQKNF